MNWAYRVRHRAVGIGVARRAALQVDGSRHCTRVLGKEDGTIREDHSSSDWHAMAHRKRIGAIGHLSIDDGA